MANLIEIKIMRASLGVWDGYASAVAGEGQVMLADVLRRLNEAHEGRVPVVMLSVDSLGGDSFGACALFHALTSFREAGGKVVAFVAGYAGSIAAIYVLAADYVVADPRAKFGLHGNAYLRSAPDGRSEVRSPENEREARTLHELDRLQRLVLSARTTATPEQVARWSEAHDAEILDAQAAKSLGFVDVVGDRRDARELAHQLALGKSVASDRQVALDSRRAADAETLRDVRLNGARVVLDTGGAQLPFLGEWSLALHSALAGLETRAESPRCHLLSRIEDYARPVELSLTGLYRHLSHATKDIAMREALIQTYDLIRSDQFQAAMHRTAGSDMLPLVTKWLQDSANDLVIPDGGSSEWLKFASATRRGLTGSVFGLHVGHALHNTLGFLNAGTRVDTPYLAKGVGQMISQRGKAVQFIQSKSSEMRNRELSLDRDLRESMQHALESGSVAMDEAKKRASMIAMWAFQAGDAIASNATWLGAYHQAIEGKVDGIVGSVPGHIQLLDEALKEKGLADQAGTPLEPEKAENLRKMQEADEAAVRWADQTVRQTLMAGRTIDLPAISRDPRAKWFTMFYGWSSNQFNQLMGAGVDAKRFMEDGQNARAFRRLTRVGLYVLMGELAYELVMGRGPQPDDDGETGGAAWSKWVAQTAVLAPFSFIPILGPVVKAMVQGGKDVTLNPTEALYSAAAKTLHSGWKVSKAFLNDDDWQQELSNFGPELGSSAAMFAGLPVSQARQALGYWTDENRDPNDTLGEQALGTLYGKKRKGSLSAAIYGQP